VNHKTDVPVAADDFLLEVLLEPFERPALTRVLSVDRELVIGREPTADLTVQGHLVSRRHVLIRAAQSGLEIEDVSRNGTLVDGVTLRGGQRRVSSECTLVVGCVRLSLRRLPPYSQRLPHTSAAEQAAT
jgi:pSer/pThr/pTyr-binding forkhead associated (FHA) protein